MSVERAVVIGGSIAGLCAARVLSDFFDEVMIVDRDEFPAGAVERAGVPQSRHVHALLVGGRRQLDRLFPGFDELMRARGALDIDFLRDFATLRPDGWWPPEASGLQTLFASRVLLESVVRELLCARRNVRLLPRHAVGSLRADGTRITGVRLQPRDGGGVTNVDTGLVVDASGRGSQAPAWLAALGLPVPADTVVDGFVGYSTRWYQAPDPWPSEWWWKGVWIDPAGPTDFRAAVLSPVEGGRWVVTAGGLGRHYPPTDEDGFTAALGTLRSPLIAEAVRHATPISPVYCNRQMANRFRHWERWPVALRGFVATGDAVCAFNPVYGQGMTSAAFTAGILADCLDAVGPTSAELPRRFFAAQARFLREPWSMATGADFRYATTEGVRPAGVHLLNPYFDLLFRACVDDLVVRRRLGEVIHMLRPARDLFSPTTIARAALSAARRLTRRDVAPTAIPALPPSRAPHWHAIGNTPG